MSRTEVGGSAPSCDPPGTPRDSRVGPIGGGSNEIQRNIIARMMGL